MKKSTANKLRMFESVHAVFKEFESSWQHIPVFVSTINAFRMKLSQLRVLIDEQAKATQGVGMKKKLLQEDLFTKMLPVQHALYLIGRSSGDLALQVRNELYVTDLRRMRISEFALRCTQLLSDIENFSEELVNYGFDLQNQIEIKNQLIAVSNWNNSWRMAVIKRKVLTEKIAHAEKELNELLRVELDRMMCLFKEEDASFYQDFKNGRLM